jgi:hypothetical protein
LLPLGIEKVQKATVDSDELDTEVLVGSIDSGDGIMTLDREVKADSKLSTLIENIDGLVGCLMRVASSVYDPFPLDVYSSDTKPNDADLDIDIASTLFPAATQSLLTRLGWASWRRRRHLKALGEKRGSRMPFSGMENSTTPRRVKKSQLREVAVDAFNFQKPVLRSGGPPPRAKPLAYPSHPAPSTTAPSTDGDSVFSNPIVELKSVTSVTETEAPIKQKGVPKPPISWEKGGIFLCPYCLDEVDIPNSIATKFEWEGHVFGDLEPYMCTFDNCLRPDKTFRARDDWFQHEMESHRIVKVWVCHACAREFNSPQAFEIHLQEKHNNVCEPNQMAMVISLCMKNSQSRPEEDVCPLCAMKLHIEALKDHIANHLEQLALTSIDGEESSEEDDTDEIASQRFDDNASEGRAKLEILNDFVEEQLGYVLPDKKGPADTGADGANIDFVRDSDDEDDSGDEGRFGAPSMRKAGDDGTDWKLANYLSNPSGKARETREPTIASSANWKIPISSDARTSTSTTSLRTTPHPKDDDFVGRDADLAKLYKILSAPGRICTLSGIGGVGKTATAVEFTHRYEQAYSYIFWTQAETRVGCADTFSLIAVALGLDPDCQDQKQLIESSRDFLETTNKRWLLVFDNVDNWADIEKVCHSRSLLRHYSRGCAMITSIPYLKIDDN